ncbi:MAG: hypothetical protein ABIH11_02155, partial [Candidatus Altiarchaeota archaeon]
VQKLRENPKILRGILRLPLVLTMLDLSPQKVREFIENYFWLNIDENELKKTKEDEIYPFMKQQISFFKSKTKYNINNARKIGYSPKYDFEKGMEQTEKWAKWANLL